MSEHINQDNAHLISGLYKEPSSIFKGEEKNFQPWHKPRKQYVRQFQWITETVELIEEIDFRDGRPFKYLGLPGKDMMVA